MSAQALRFEALTQAVWPAAECYPLAGWELRFTGGRSKRTNSVQTTGAGPADIDSTISDCEARYRERGLRPIFKLTDASEPSDLDALLVARGYEKLDPTSTQVLGLEVAPTKPSREVQIEQQLSAEWLAARQSLGGFDPTESVVLGEVLGRLSTAGACAFASIRGREGETMAQGLAVIREGSVCLCELGVATQHRRQGLGREVVAALLSFGSSGGAGTAWLQVVAANLPAISLYAGLGFSEAYRYWYRAAPEAEFR